MAAQASAQRAAVSADLLVRRHHQRIGRQAVGKRRQLLVPKESYHVIGILLAVIGQFDVPVARLGPTSWKSMALGKGHGMTRKPGPRDSFEYGVLAWARGAGYSGSLWDEADAVGLATAGGVLLEARRRAG